MIVKKIWTKGYYGVITDRYTGWYLFGIIPLYVIREKYKNTRSII